MKLRWLRQASLSLDAEYDYIRRENPKAARRVFSRIISAVKRLKDFPLSGRIGQVDGTRELIITGLPYMVIYQVASDGVEILRVFHTSRDYPAAFQ
jgi:toxin ParE1/3/4